MKLVTSQSRICTYIFNLKPKPPETTQFRYTQAHTSLQCENQNPIFVWPNAREIHTGQFYTGKKLEQKLNRNLKKRKQKKNEPKFNPMPHTERTFDTFNGFDVLYNVQCSGTLRALGHSLLV